MSLLNYMGCLMEFCKSCIIILYENVFQNPELFLTQVSLYPEKSTLDKYSIEFHSVRLKMIVYNNNVSLYIQLSCVTSAVFMIDGE
jgi:hypothetical protein